MIYSILQTTRIGIELLDNSLRYVFSQKRKSKKKQKRTKHAHVIYYEDLDFWSLHEEYDDVTIYMPSIINENEQEEEVELSPLVKKVDQFDEAESVTVCDEEESLYIGLASRFRSRENKVFEEKEVTVSLSEEVESLETTSFHTCFEEIESEEELDSVVPLDRKKRLPGILNTGRKRRGSSVSFVDDVVETRKEEVFDRDFEEDEICPLEKFFEGIRDIYSLRILDKNYPGIR